MARSHERLKLFFRKLKDDLEKAEGCSPSRAYAVSRQTERAEKRADLGDSSLSQKAVDDFVSLNGIVGSTCITLPDDLLHNSRLFVRTILERYSTAASELNIQVSLDRTHLLELWRFGPGASFDTRGTHAAQKIGSAWTATSSAIPEVRRLRRNHPYLHARDSMEGCPIREVRGSKLSTVRKNQEKDRTIAIEPLGNMCLQLAAGEYLTGALKSIGLDITKQQPLNKAMAQEASIFGLLCTVDLKSASDMIHPELVRLVLPPEWYEYLMSIRSTETLLPNGEWLKLNMISTMGNGFTFPLMTLLIVSLIYGYRCISDKASPTLWIDWKHTCVFGDDIIIPTHEFDGFCQVLKGAGLVVNRDKSYFEGPFRESCGGDYYLGDDVTPFYVESLKNDAEIYVALNKMSEWSGKVNLFLPTATEFLFRELGHPAYLVPEWESPTAGFRCTQVSRRYKKLHPVPFRRKLEADNFFLLPLACAGYVTTDLGGIKSIQPFDPNKPAGKNGRKVRDQEVFFMPRPRNSRYRTTKSRLPNGFLDGRDPTIRDPITSSHCDFVAWFGSAVFLKAAGS